MPLYEYRCDACGRRFELIQRFSDPPAEKCPTCGGPVHKLLSSPAIQFKGSGWYITDYAKKDQSVEAKPETGASDGAGAKDKTEGTKDQTEKAEKADKSDKGAAPSTSSPSSSSTKDIS